MQTERRAYDKDGNLLLTEEQRANPERLIPDGCPPEFRAKIRLIFMGRTDVAAVEYDQRSAEWRANALNRVRETAADL